ncbi:dihydrofolate reductase family protein [Streptomyces sp. NPDC007025]|uniref:dihydrofolate reductase family protein n=1 Tax=Streptomyces sp. NPDC007025 TaxID=3364771 RepID=UPI003681F82B
MWTFAVAEGEAEVSGPTVVPGDAVGRELAAMAAGFDTPEGEEGFLAEAVVLGRRLFDVVDGPGGWDDRTGYGAGEVGKPAFLVVTSTPPESVRLGDLDWTFVTTGLPDAVTAARERAEAASSDSGRDLDAVLMGGGALIGSALEAGLVDMLQLHLAPVVLGSGTPLFTGGTPRTLVQRAVTVTSTATHLTYDVR